MIIRLGSNTIDSKVILFAGAFLLPYLESGPIQDLLSYKGEKVYIPASIPLLVCAIVILIVTLFPHKKEYVQNKGIYVSTRFAISLNVYVAVIGMIRCIETHEFLVPFIQMVWLVLPLIYAILYLYTINTLRLNYIMVIKIGLVFFLCHLYFCIAYNFFAYSFSFGMRLNSAGGGPVIFGYTLAIMMALLLAIRKHCSQFFQLVFMTSCLIGVFFTGSRGGIWPALLLYCIFIIFVNNILLKGLMIMTVLFILISCNPIEFISAVLPRVFETKDSRADTWLGIVTAFQSVDFMDIVFGKGIGHFFPYQEWCLSTNKEAQFNGYNYFSFNGVLLLVQPHNSYIYSFIELGLVGTLVFVAYFVKSIVIIRKTSAFNILLILLILMLNNFDAVFFINPGAAGLWWIVFIGTLFMENNKTSLERDIGDSFEKNK